MDSSPTIRRGGEYYTPGCEPLRLLLRENFRESTWEIVWSALTGLTIEGQAHGRPGLFYFAVIDGRDSYTGVPRWKAWAKYSPDWLPRDQARSTKPAHGIDPMQAIAAIYPALEWADGAAEACASRCKSCSAKITWLETTNGKATPVNLPGVLVALDDPGTPRATVVLSDGRVMTGRLVGGAAEVKGPVVTGYISHFATCPRAQAHRRAR